MKHLYFIVEGETELEFINRIVIPYLYRNGLNTYIQGIMVTMSGGGHGFNHIQHFKNTIEPILNYDNQPIITTMLDYYGINSEKKLPDFLECNKLSSVDGKIQCLENALNEQVQSIKSYRFFIPYIQKHEMETLLFANPEVGFELESEELINAVLEVCTEFPNIEDINNSYETAPSKRLYRIYKENGSKYQKSTDAVAFIAEPTGIEVMLEKAPRFKNWIENLIETVRNS
jgi:hypothetical protein